jgi:hypothetical protein
MAVDDADSGEFHRVRRGLNLLAALEVEIETERMATAVRLGIADTLALERARGEDVDQPSGQGPANGVRVRTRDGLETLLKTGAIDDVRLRAGLRYRELYEAADPERDLKSQMADLYRHRESVRGAPRQNEAWAERRLRLSRALAAVEAKVQAADRNGPALRALREVAGHARCISHLVRGGGAQAAYRRALVEALDVCVDHFALSR